MTLTLTLVGSWRVRQGGYPPPPSWGHSRAPRTRRCWPCLLRGPGAPPQRTACGDPFSQAARGPIPCPAPTPGIVVAEGAKPRIVANDICDHKMHSIHVLNIKSNPIISGNYIHDGMGTGVLLTDACSGSLYDNDISGHGAAAIRIEEGADPVIRANRVHGNDSCAISNSSADGQV